MTSPRSSKSARALKASPLEKKKEEEKNEKTTN
jgi:hypothetical protein